MRRSRGLVARTGMFALVAGMLLAACGGGGDKKTTTTTTSPTSTTSTSTTTAPPVSTSTPPVTTCLISQLSASLIDGVAGAGQRYATIVFTNNSDRACTMFGFIGMQLLTNNGNAPLPTDVVRNEGVVPKVEITLPANGGQAYTTLHWTVVSGVGEPQDVQCQPTPDTVQITPPNEGDSLVQPWMFGFVCQMGRIDVNPMQLGAGA